MEHLADTVAGVTIESSIISENNATFLFIAIYLLDGWMGELIADCS
jgi:hypothetical protein